MTAALQPGEILPDPSSCALLVIDLQVRLAAAMQAERLAEVTRNSLILIETARVFDLPVLVSEQYPRGLGPTLPAVLAALPPASQPVEKMAFSCCAAPALASQLVYDQVLICGMETHVCVLQTVLDLLAQGRKVYVVADAVRSRTDQNHQLGLDLMRQAGAVIGSAEIFAFGLLRTAGSERFKHISKLVK